MRLPLILCESGDVSLFESVEDLESYVESPDIAGYRVFDANGNLFHLTTAQPTSNKTGTVHVIPVFPVRIDIVESPVNAARELETLLRGFLLHATGTLYDQMILSELLGILQKTIGFTR